MPDPAALAAAGPWAVVVALGTALGIAFVREWFVQGGVYKREVKRGDDLTATNAAMSKALDTLTADSVASKESIATLTETVRGLNENVRVLTGRLYDRDRDAP